MTKAINTIPLIIDECDGTETLFGNRAIFNKFVISSGSVGTSSFRKKNKDEGFDSLLEKGEYEKEKPTKETGVDIHKTPEGYRGRFRNLFSSISENLESLCLTQGQIVNFCKKHKDQVNPEGMTLFVFKLNKTGSKKTLVLVLLRGSSGITIEPLECDVPSACDQDTDIRLVIPTGLAH